MNSHPETLLTVITQPLQRKIIDIQILVLQSLSGIRNVYDRGVFTKVSMFD